MKSYSKFLFLIVVVFNSCTQESEFSNEELQEQISQDSRFYEFLVISQKLVHINRNSS